MQYLGAIREKEEAIRQAEKIAREQNRIVVIEKAKTKDDAGKLHRCWRGWLDVDGSYTGCKEYGVRWKKIRRVHRKVKD